MKNLLFIVSIFAIQFISFSQTQEIKLMSYNLLNFPDGRTDCGSGNINPLNRTDTLRKIVGFVKPDILVACEIQSKAGADTILTRSLNVFGQTNYQMAPFQASIGGAGTLNNAMYYNTNKLIFLRQKGIRTAGRDINHYTLYVIDPNISVHRDTIFIEVYMSHLKAGSGSAEQATRTEQTTTFRNYVDAQPAGRHHFICGDMNVYRSSEACYQKLLTGGSKPFFDPISKPGSWNNNGSFAAIHTQSPRSSGSIACGSTGGLDDRFDQILVTNNVLSGANRVEYQVDSYEAVGNDGLHFNSNLLAGPVNSDYPDSVIRALYNMSDHLPVTLKFTATLPTSNGLALTYSNNGPICIGQNIGQATVTPLLGQAPYTYSWDANANNQATQTATGLEPGSYCVYVTDANNLKDTVCFEITGAPALEASVFVVASNLNCNGEAVTIVSGGVSPYTYLWNDPLAQTAQTAVGLCPGTYNCTITDQSGCTATKTALILGPLSIGELLIENHQLFVAPNPIQNELRLQNSSDLDLNIKQLQLVDLQGKIIVTGNEVGISSGKSLTWPTDNLPKGIYFLKMQLDNSEQVIKVVK